MQKISKEIQISNNTLAILPAKEIEFQSYVLENDATYNIKKTPLQIIKAACINTDWSTFDGRREAVTYHTGFKQKVPIPISIKYAIYAFPTHAINSHYCAWIFPRHILRINKHGTNQSTIQFKNGRTIILDISYHILNNQLQRTFQIMNLVNMESKGHYQ